MRSIQYGKRQIHYDVKRGKRKKTVAIHVDADRVTIRVPQRLEEVKIRLIMEKKARWICDRQERIRKDKLNDIGKEYISGESFYYLGRKYRLKLVKKTDGDAPACKLQAGRLLVGITDQGGGERREEIKKALIAWFRIQADKKIRERLPLYAVKLGLQPASVEIKNQKTQWGSCSRSGSLRFNWKIVMTPISIMDYVIVHELCHLIYSHHQSQFWGKVESVIPDCKKRRKWLKEHSLLINSLS